MGNGVTDPKYDGNALVPFAFGKSLISADLYHEVDNKCGGSYWNASHQSDCDMALNKVYAEGEQKGLLACVRGGTLVEWV